MKQTSTLFSRQVLLSPVSCLLSPVSCLLSPVSCLLSIIISLVSISGLYAQSSGGDPSGGPGCDPVQTSLSCNAEETPGLKKLTIDTSNIVVPSGKSAVACYAPVYFWWQSPTVYHAPGPNMPSDCGPEVFPLAEAEGELLDPPSTSSGHETVYIPMYNPTTDPVTRLKGVYVWFEYGSWRRFELNGVGRYCWDGEGELCSWQFCQNPSGECFAPGTHLLTPDGSKPIEMLKVGDQVISSVRDEPGASPTMNVVSEVVTTRAVLLELVLGGKTIRTTVEHPVYVKEKGWVPAKSIAAGDWLRSHNEDSWVCVESAKVGHESKVYNILLDGKSGYFVGHHEWGFSMWASDLCRAGHRSPATQLAIFNSSRLNFELVPRKASVPLILNCK